MARHVEVRLELDPEGDPVRGVFHDGRGNAREFYGWLQLMSAIEAARRGPERTVADPSEHDR
jgi:hypothetical protein